MRREAPYLLGKNLYLAGAHMPTWSIRADAQVDLDQLIHLE